MPGPACQLAYQNPNPSGTPPHACRAARSIAPNGLSRSLCITFGSTALLPWRLCPGTMNFPSLVNAVLGPMRWPPGIWIV